MITLRVLGITLLGLVAGVTAVRIPTVAGESERSPVVASPSPAPSRTPEPAAALPPSRPVLLEIPRLRVRSRLLSLGKGADGAPEPPSHARWAGWYRYGAAPGATGPAVIAGHAAAHGAPAVFHRLGELVPGDEVSVLRRDRRVAVFRIERVERVEGDRFPADRVYGRVSYPGIRLVTYGEAAAGRQTYRVIAYGRLVRSR